MNIGCGHDSRLLTWLQGTPHQGQLLLDGPDRQLDDLRHVRDLDPAVRLDQPRQVLLQERVVQRLQIT